MANELVTLARGGENESQKVNHDKRARFLCAVRKRVKNIREETVVRRQDQAITMGVTLRTRNTLLITPKLIKTQHEGGEGVAT